VGKHDPVWDIGATFYQKPLQAIPVQAPVAPAGNYRQNRLALEEALTETVDEIKDRTAGIV
jgi:hypothetical protein